MNTLDYLLEIEAQAAAMIKDAQVEADMRIHENEEKNNRTFDDRYKIEAHESESLLKKEIDRLKEQYHQKLEDYRKEISGINVDTENFSFLFNDYLTKEG